MDTFAMLHQVIDAIVAFAGQHFREQPELSGALPLATDGQGLGEVLWGEAIRSAQCLAGDVPVRPYVRMPDVVAPRSAVEFLYLLDRLEHASNAAPDFSESRAGWVIEALRKRAIRQLPGFYPAASRPMERTAVVLH